MFSDYIEALHKLDFDSGLKVSLIFMLLIAPGCLGILVYFPDLYKDISSISILLISLSLSVPVCSFMALALFYFSNKYEGKKELSNIVTELTAIEEELSGMGKEEDKNEFETYQRRVESLRSRVDSFRKSHVNTLYEGAGLVSGAYYPLLLISYILDFQFKIFIVLFLLLLIISVLHYMYEKKNGKKLAN